MRDFERRALERQAARKAAGLDQTHPVEVRTPAPVRLPCLHEGPIVEPCKTCNAEARHVRSCGHPAPSDPDRDVCTRGVVSAKVQSCATCPDYEPPHA